MIPSSVTTAGWRRRSRNLFVDLIREYCAFGTRRLIFKGCLVDKDCRLISRCASMEMELEFSRETVADHSVQFTAASFVHLVMVSSKSHR